MVVDIGYNSLCDDKTTQEVNEVLSMNYHLTLERGTGLPMERVLHQLCHELSGRC